MWCAFCTWRTETGLLVAVFLGGKPCHCHLCPKKEKPEMARRGSSIFMAKDMRPLSLCDTTIKLLEVSLRMQLDEWFRGWAHPAQRGFLRGRLMSHSFLELGAHAIRACYEGMGTSRRPAMLLFDAKHAFPSISHQFLWMALAAAGVPAQMMKCIKSLYVDGQALLEQGQRQLFCVRG